MASKHRPSKKRAPRSTTPSSNKPCRTDQSRKNKLAANKKPTRSLSRTQTAVCGMAVATALGGLDVHALSGVSPLIQFRQPILEFSNLVPVDKPEKQFTGEVVVIDGGLKDTQFLAQAAKPGAKIIYLQSGQNGIAQIAAALQGLQKVKAIHIFSHGGDGYIQLGNEKISIRNLSQHTAELTAIRQVLVPGGDILLYGCEVAKDNAGKMFIEDLALATGANVAASNNLTGQHGDWELEIRTGVTHTASIAVPQYPHDLADYLVTNLNNTGAGSLRAMLATAVGNGTDDTIRFDPSLFTSGAGTITLASELNILGNNSSDNLTIVGPGADLLTISGNNASRIFVAAGSYNTATITMSGMTLSNGYSGSGGYGGSMRIYKAGSLNLDHMVIQNGSGYVGGAHLFIGDQGNLSISHSTFKNNTGTGGAAGLVVFMGTGKTATITNSTISGNTNTGGNYGGGLSVGGYGITAIINISNTTISGNIINRPSNSVGLGGGIGIGSGTVTLTNTTITGNKVYGATYGNSGGGLALLGQAKVTLNNSIVFGNTGDQTLYTTGNRRLGPGQDIYLRNNTDGISPFNRYGLFGSNNIVGSLGINVSAPSGANPASTETGRSFLTGTSSTDPGLGALAYNGGFVKTHAITTGSSGIGAGLSNGATVADVSISSSTTTVSGATVNRLAISGTGTGFTVANVPSTDSRGYATVSTIELGAFEVSTAGTGTFNFVGTHFPVHNSVSVPVSSNLTMDFGQSLTAVSSKNFIIYNNNGSVFETIPVTDSRITFSTGYSGAANSKITINPTSALSSSSTYYVLIDSGAFTDANGNTFSGITSNTSWRIATGTSIAAPTVNAVPVIANLASDTNTFERGSSEYFDTNGDISITDSDSADFNGGYLIISRTSGTADGSFNLDTGAVVKAGTSEGTADATMAAGETIYVDVSGTFRAVGTVHSTSTGQSGADLRIDFNTAFATPTNVTTIPLNMKYGSDTTGARVFGLVVNDSIGSSSSSSFTITGSDTAAPTISSVSIPNTAMKIGDTVTATLTVTSDTDNYTTGSGGISGNIGGFTLGSLSRTNATTYTATFTVTSGGTDVAAGSSIPVSVTLTDSSGNASTAYTTAISQSSDAIDANRPTVSSIVRQTPSASTTNATSLVWRVTFNEAASNVTTGDFSVSGTTATVTGISTVSSTVYDVTISGGDLASYNSTATLSFTGGQDIADSVGNTLTSTTPTGTNQPTYTLDHTAPAFSSVTPASSAYINTSSTLGYTLSEALASGTITVTRTGGTADASSPYTCTLQGTALSSGARTVALTSSGNGCSSTLNLVDGTIYSFAFDGTDSVGNAATTVTHTSVTADFTAPTVHGTTPIVANDADTSTSYTASDTVTLQFSEPVLTSNITIGNLTVSNGHSLGTGASVSPVSASGGYAQSFTLTLGTSPTLATGDTLTITAGNVVDRAANSAGASAVFTAPAFGPTVTASRITLSGASGISGAYKIGDTVTVTWDNTGSGDNNSGITGVTADFSQFGGGAAVTMTHNGSGTWTASYTLIAGSIDATNRTASISASNAVAPTTVTGSTSVTVDNTAPTVTASLISVSGASGPSGIFVPGDTVTVTWDNSGSGDNNADTIASVALDFTALGGGSSVSASNTGGTSGVGGTWSASYTLLAGAPIASNLNIVLTATDNAGNSLARTGTNNLTINNVPAAPTVSGEVGDSNGTLTFTSPTTNGNALTGYQVIITPTGGAAVTLNLSSVSAGTTAISGTVGAEILSASSPVKIKLTGLSNGTAHSVTVAARNGIGLGSASSAVALTPVSSAVPVIPVVTPPTLFVTIPTDKPQTQVTASGEVLSNVPLGTTVSSNGVIVLPTPSNSGGTVVQAPVEIKSTTPNNAVIQLPAGTPVTFTVGGQTLTLTPTPPDPVVRGKPAPAVVPVQVQTKTVTVTDANGNTQTVVALQVTQGTATLSGPTGEVISAFGASTNSGCSQNSGFIKALTADTKVKASAADPQWLLLGHIDAGAIMIHFDDCAQNGNQFSAGSGRDVIIYRGEQAFVDKAAQVARILVRSAAGDAGDAGDPLALAGIPGFGYGSSTAIPQLAKDTGRLPSGSSLQARLAAVALAQFPTLQNGNWRFSNQDGLGGVRFSIADQEVILAPVGEVLVIPGAADSVSITPSSQGVITANETVMVVNAMPRDVPRLVSDVRQLDATAAFQVVDDGSLRLTFRGTTIGLQPNWNVAYNAAYTSRPSFMADEVDERGACHYADGWRQCFYPIVNDYVSLLNLAKRFDANASVVADRKGIVQVTLGANSFQLLPDWLVINTPAAHANDEYWVEGGRFFIRNPNGLAQGFAVR